MLLLESLEHEELLVGSPVALEKRVVQLVDDVVHFGEHLQVAETSHTVVVVGGQDFRVLADVLLAYVALDFVRGVQDILASNIAYVKHIVVLVRLLVHRRHLFVDLTAILDVAYEEFPNT